MDFSEPLLRGVLLRRYQRFLADVRLDTGEEVTAHCPNSGSLLSVNAPGSEVWLSLASNPARKLKYTWELVRVGDTLVGINTGRPNALVAEALSAGAIPELAGYDRVRREVRYGLASRIDLLLTGAGRPTCYVEIKNVTMKRGNGDGWPIEFPDSVTARGTKHLGELAAMVREGARAVMMFLAQRDDARRFSIASDIDPAYAAALKVATEAGVEAMCYTCRVGTGAIRINGRVAMFAEG